MSLSDNSNMPVTFVVFSWDVCGSLRSLWFLLWWVIDLFKLDIWRTFLWDSESYLMLCSCFSLVLFLPGMRGVISSLTREYRICFLQPGSRGSRGSRGGVGPRAGTRGRRGGARASSPCPQRGDPSERLALAGTPRTKSRRMPGRALFPLLARYLAFSLKILRNRRLKNSTKLQSVLA